MVTGLRRRNSPKVTSRILNFLKRALDRALRTSCIGTSPKFVKKFLIFGFMSLSIWMVSVNSRMSGIDLSKTTHRNARMAPALDPLTAWTSRVSTWDN